MLPNNLKWDQAIIDDNSILNGIVLLLAFKQNRSPRPIGTAFIIGVEEQNAIAVTAAHNLQAIGEAQAPIKKHHATALPEFLNDSNVLDLDRKKVRAVCFENGKVEISVITRATYDKDLDIAFFSFIPQSKKIKFFSKYRFNLDDYSPKLGDEIAVLGLGHISVLFEERDGKGKESFQIECQSILRRGTVTNIHNNGHILCRGPCIETSIPVFPGMSGAPVMVLDKPGRPMKPFGLVSSDLEHDKEIKNDQTISGSSIIALLNPIIKSDTTGQIKTTLKLNNAFFVKNKNDKCFESRNSEGDVSKKHWINPRSATYDRYFVINTSYKPFGENLICATSCLAINQDIDHDQMLKKGDQISVFEMPRLIFLAKQGTNPERYGWMKVIDALLRSDLFNVAWSYGVVVDNDLNDLQKINVGEKPILDDFFTPDNVSLIYASADAGKESLIGKLIRATDRVAKKSLEFALEKFDGQKSFNMQRDFWDVTTLKDKVNISF
jgi:hypothetical protein